MLAAQEDGDVSDADTEPIPSSWLANEFDDTPDHKLGKALTSMIAPEAEYADFWGDDRDEKPSLMQKKIENTPIAWRKSLALVWFQREKEKRKQLVKGGLATSGHPACAGRLG